MNSINEHVRKNEVFFNTCLHHLRETNTVSVSQEEDIVVLNLMNAALVTYNSRDDAQCLKMLGDIIEDHLYCLARQHLKEIVRLIFNLFSIGDHLKEETQFRLKLLSEIHEMQVFAEFTQSVKSNGHLSNLIKIPFPKIEFSNSQPVHNLQRTEIAERLLAAYFKALEDEKTASIRRSGNDLWTTVLDTELADLISVIEKKNAKALADFLLSFGSTPGNFGGFATCVDNMTASLKDQNLIALTYFDKLISLGESLGVLSPDIPITPNAGRKFDTNIDELIANIEAALSISITPPAGIIYTDGIVTSRGLINRLHINGLYSATRASALNENKEPCCEYGGGIGIAAMYARRLGITDYTIFDLPVTCLLSGHYLLHAIGQDQVTLYGEARQDNSVNILPYWETMNAETDKFYLALNQDSFPEVARDLVELYLVQIKRNTRQYFLSINHEGFPTRKVSSIVNHIGGFNKLYRMKSWIYQGYLDELYVILEE